ncbi:MAG TPA: hypothetical protein VFD04_07880 [Actinomycetes bacterium]|nr:hypothetical protein [Actinomycetes bacterium]
MAPLDAEVVVDHLGDAGAAAGADLGAGPQADDPLAVPAGGADQRGGGGDQPGEGEQEQVEAPARPDSHGPDRSIQPHAAGSGWPRIEPAGAVRAHWRHGRASRQR